jgi:CRP/FNR family transcriptional regulator, cyclic AMP receptor protein
MSDELVQALARIPLFAGVDPDELEALSATMNQVTLRENEMLYEQGQTGETMYLIAEGELKVFTLGVGGREVVLDILSANDVLGELSLLDGKARSAYARATTDCVLMALDRGPFLDHLCQHPETAIRLMANMGTRLRQTILQTESLSVSDSQARLAQAILFLAERDGEVSPGLATSILNKKDLAATIGTSEEWVNRTLSDWSRDGIIGITGGRRLLLHDVDAVRALSARGRR